MDTNEDLHMAYERDPGLIALRVDEHERAVTP